MDLERIVETYKYILQFHPIKYLGIAIMIFGPLFVIYRFVFLQSPLYELLFGIIGSVLMGSFVFSVGWDPYG